MLLSYSVMITYNNLRRQAALFGERVVGNPPVPPPEKIEAVIGVPDQTLFLRTGRKTASIIRRVLKKNSVDTEGLGAVLDFGCGIGRVLRHLRKLPAEMHGSDYNPDLIAWCRENLRFAEFAVNPLEGPLAYEDGKFGLVYAWSVFTHLTERQQRLWINELTRVLRPGGYLFLTVSGETLLDNYWTSYRGYLEGTGQQEYLEEILETYGEEYLKNHTPLSVDQTKRFESGELVVLAENDAGKNTCAAFHPEAYVREELAGDLEVMDFLPGGAGGSFQDAYLLRSPKSV